MTPAEIRERIATLFRITRELSEATGRPFTLDGHAVGSIGEMLAAQTYGLELCPPSTESHDAFAPDGRKVEIKATGSREEVNLSALKEGRLPPDHLLVLKLNHSGGFDEIYNGEAARVWAAISHRKPTKNGQHSIGFATLRRLQDDIERLPELEGVK